MPANNTISYGKAFWVDSHVFGSGVSSSDVELSLVSPGELVVAWPRPAVVVSVVLAMGGAVMAGVTSSVSVMRAPGQSVRAHLGWHGVGVAVAPAWSLPLSAPGWAGVASRAVCSLHSRGSHGSGATWGAGSNKQTALLGSRQQNEIH